MKQWRVKCLLNEAQDTLTDEIVVESPLLHCVVDALSSLEEREELTYLPGLCLAKLQLPPSARLDESSSCFLTSVTALPD